MEPGFGAQAADVQRLIAQHALAPLPREGGYFRVTSRTASSSTILYLVTADEWSALHRIAQAETWHFQLGSALEHVQLHLHDGRLERTALGGDVARGERATVHVPAGVWQGARLAPCGRASGGAHALVTCTVVPPYDERSFELLSRDDGLRQFPAHRELILGLTR